MIGFDIIFAVKSNATIVFFIGNLLEIIYRRSITVSSHLEPFIFSFNENAFREKQQKFQRAFSHLFLDQFLFFTYLGTSRGSRGAFGRLH